MHSCVILLCLEGLLFLLNPVWIFPTEFLEPLVEGFAGDISYEVECSKVSYSQHIDQLCVSTVIINYWKEKLF